MEDAEANGAPPAKRAREDDGPANGESAEMSEPPASSAGRPSSSTEQPEGDGEEGTERPGSGEDIYPHINEWVERQKRGGVRPEDILGSLGLRVSGSNMCEEDVLWSLCAQLVCEFRERLRPRQKLAHVNTIDDVVELINRSENIIVLTGAGISVSAGIPDFRSRNGVYQMVEEKFDLPDPQSLFDIQYFIQDPEPFFTFAKNLYPGTYMPTPSHFFIKLLEDHHKLLNNYTQNIDTLEQVAGISSKIMCHGSFATATCLACKNKVPCDDIREDIMAQQIPRCTQCTHDLNIMKPDIVFFGEPLGEHFDKKVQEDMPSVDLLIVMGSSLRVQPVASIPTSVPAEVPQILINREVVMAPHKFDVELLGDCDSVVKALATRLGWDLSECYKEAGLEVP